MAMFKDALGVLNGLRRVAIAYSVEVTKEIGDLVSILAASLQNQCDREENHNHHGLPDDFPGWENFATGEFGLGVEYNSSESPLSHPPSPPPPPKTSPMPSNKVDGGQRSFHTQTNYRFLHSPGRMKGFTGHFSLNKSTVRFITSGDTVVEPTSNPVSYTHLTLPTIYSV